MVRRTTIELDPVLVERAKRALGMKTTRATVEEALRRAADAGEAEQDRRTLRQRRYLKRLNARVELTVLAGEDMWR
jgi:Arc/MetJ family transcription regulator